MDAVRKYKARICLIIVVALTVLVGCSAKSIDKESTEKEQMAEIQKSVQTYIDGYIKAMEGKNLEIKPFNSAGRIGDIHFAASAEILIDGKLYSQVLLKRDSNNQYWVSGFVAVAETLKPKK